MNKKRIHDIVRARYGQWPDHCDLCGLTEEKLREKKRYYYPYYFQWSNRTGVYDVHHWNWWQLCMLCHRRYDTSFLGQYPKKKREITMGLLKNGRSKSEVAVLMGISRQRVQQIAKKV